MTLGQRFARLATNVAVRWPRLWPVVRAPLRGMFDRLAPDWGRFRPSGRLEALESVLERLPEPPRRILDVGAGTGSATVLLAERWPAAEVVGVDLSGGMVARARAELPEELADRVRYEVADAAALPFADASFDLVVLANMIPFFDELARVVAPGGAVGFSFSSGSSTPIYVDPQRIRAELARRGFGDFELVEAGSGTAVLARKADRS